MVHVFHTTTENDKFRIILGTVFVVFGTMVKHADYEQRKAKAKLGVIFGLGVAQITRTARAIPTVLQ